MLASVLSYLRAGGLFLLAATLTACGGGGGGGGGFISTPIGGDTSATTYSLSIETLNPAGEASLQLTSEAPLTVNVSLLGSDGSTPSNELITLTTNVASIDPANGSAVTNGAGIATFTLSFDGTEGAGSVEASYTTDGNTVTTSVNIESILIRETRVLSIDTTNSQGIASNELSLVDPMTVALTLTEEDGATPVSGALLSLTSTIGTVAPGSGSALTDDFGIARFTVSDSGEQGAGVLVGSYESDTLSLAIQKNIQAVASSAIYTLTLGEMPNDGVVTNLEPVAASAQLVSADPAQYPVANQIIDISSDIVSIDPANGRVRTDADGNAIFAVGYRGVIGAGTIEASYNAGDESASAMTAIETQLVNNEPTPGVVAALALSTNAPDGSNTREFSAVQPLTVSVQMIDAFGDPVTVDGQVISLTTDVANVTPENGSAVTSGGIASFTLEFNGTVGAGLAEASLAVADTTYVGNIAIQAVSETPYLVTLSRSAGALTLINPISVSATVTQLDGTPVDGGIVNFESDLGTLTPASAVTGADGIAETMIEFADESGAGTLTATYSVNGEDFSNQFNFDSVVVDPPYELSFQLVSDGVDVSASGRFTDLDPLDVTVTLVDDAGDPVAGERVALETSIGSVNTPANAEAVTDVNGEVLFSVVSDGASGAGTLTATFASQLGDVTANKNIQSVVADDVYNLVITSITADGVIQDGQPITVSAELSSSDPANYPVRFQNVSASTTIGNVAANDGALASTATGRTDANGLIEFTVAYGGVVGAGTVTLSFADAPNGSTTVSANIVVENPILNLNLRVTTSDTLGAVTRQFDADNPLVVDVAVVDDAGLVVDVDNVPVTLETTIGAVAAPATTLVQNGVASFVLLYDGTVGAGEITATYGDQAPLLQQRVAVEATAADPYSVVLTTSGGNLSITNDLDLTATVTRGGIPIEAEIVSFSSTIGALSADAGVTTAAGEATSTLSYDGTPGAGSVTASIETDIGMFSASVAVQSVEVAIPYSLSFALESAGADVTATGRFTDLDPLDVTVTLVDDAGDPVAGERVALETSIGSVNTPANAEAVTDANGEALFSVVSGGASGAGTLTATYTSQLGDVTANKNIQSVVADDVYNLVITSITADGVIQDGQPITVRAELTSTDLVNYPVRFQNINASTTIGNIAANDGALASTATGRTDADGRVEFTVAYGGVVGAGTVTLSFADAPNGSATVSANIVVENPILNLNLQVTTSDTLGAATRQFDADNPLIVDVAVVDDAGLVVDIDNVLVTLETTIGAIAAPATTLVQDGMASFVLLYDGTVGAGEITATYGDQAPLLQQRVAVEATAAEPYSVVLTTSGGNLSITNDIDLTATVTRGGVPIEAEIVSFSSTIGALSADAGVTTAAGEATSTLSYDGTPGAGSVTASIETDIGMFSATVPIQAVAEAIPYALSILPLTELDGVTANNQLSAETSLLVTVELLEGAAGLENRVVVLETDSTLATVMPDNGAALTDGNGQATFVLTYGGSTGAGTLVARYDGIMGTVSDDETFESIVNPVEIGSLDDNGDFVDDIIRVEPSTTVGYLGSVELLFAVGNNIGERLISTQSIRIESPCLLNGFASLSTDSVIELTDGIGSTTYTATDACSDTTDEVTATLVQAGNANPASATTTLSLSAAPAADERFITFISATPANIALQGTGGGVGLEERAQVTFEVRDGSGNPVAGQEVTFELSRTTGGLILADVSATTDASGRVAATVISGTIATPVRVIATTERSPADLVNDPISVVSDSLTVSSGIVTQARFSVGVDTFNPAAAADINGISVTLTATAYDRFGNAVPDGTAVNFTSECGGIVDPENGGPRGACETVNGSCQLEWRSQPAADTVCADNRVTIMAHALGEEAFSDDNGDGYYTNGESFSDNSEAFRNDNESSDVDGPTYDAGELFIDLDNDGSFGEATPIANAPAGLYNGIACVSDGTVCSSDAISVFSNIEIVAGPLDASSLNISVEDAAAVLLDPAVDPMVPGSYVVRVTDAFGNVPPLGTVVSASSTGECEVATPDATMSNSNAQQAFAAGVSIIASGANDATTSDTITISVTIPESEGGSDNPNNVVFACNL